MSAHRVMVTIAASLCILCPAAAEITRFADPHPRGRVIEYWQLTHDPAFRDHANYHNTECWSPDGRYICYSHYDSPPGSLEVGRVHIVDLHTGEDIFVGPGHKGGNPRWAQQHNWLFYALRNPEGGELWEKGIEVWRYDCATGEQDLITWGWEFPGSVDRHDTWIYGDQRRRDIDARIHYACRARIAPASEMEIIRDRNGFRPLCNPGHDVISLQAAEGGDFGPGRLWLDPDGGSPRVGVPKAQDAHACWSGDGQWQLLGNYQVRGRRWDEPFPSDLHLLANVSVGDISPCGRSGRWLCSDYELIDLRSGDGTGLPRPPSVLCYPNTIPDSSDPYDADPKGSPDGTKICFVSNYPFDRAPFTWVTATITTQSSLPVESTAGFPDSGVLNVLGEVIGYSSKTDTSFEGIERHKYGTGIHDFVKLGWCATLFTERLMTDEERARAVPPSQWLLDAIAQVGGDPATSPLPWQRQTDVYCSVVRLPDPPHLRAAGGRLELIPGENHRETFGYYLQRDGELLPGEPLRPAETVMLAAPGTYTATAVEWSGLEGSPSLPLRVEAAAQLVALAEPPPDFSWTSSVWLVGGTTAAEDAARTAPAATCEIRHLHDGVIRRELYERGLMVAAHDLNAHGYATRRLTHQGGVLAAREYWREDRDERLSLETFGPDGLKLEEIHWDLRLDPPRESDHWWYDHGWPLRRSIRGGSEVWERQGEAWVKTG